MGGGASKNARESDQADVAGKKAEKYADLKKSKSRKVLDKIDEDLAHSIFGDIRDELTPVENAAQLLKAALGDPKLPKKTRASIQFSLQVLSLGSGRGSSAPIGFGGMISQQGSTIDLEVEQWLLDSFTPDGALGREKLNGVKRFKAVGMSIFCAENLMRARGRDEEYHMPLPIEVDGAKEEAIMARLAQVDSWDFDIFALEAIPGVKEHILEIVVWHILHRRKLVHTFHLSHNTLRNWLAYAQSSYQDTEYHNATHAADVVQTLHVILKMGGQAFLTDVQVLALILSAAMHDVGHDGLNNGYHKRAMTSRALAFNDISIQENFHASNVLTRMAQDETVNLFIHFNELQRTEMRRMMIELILGTDMSKHFTVMSDFKNEVTKLGTDPEAWHGSVDLLMGVLLHCSDISNPAKPTACAKEWASRVQSEFFRQGDKEHAEGHIISPNCNRQTTSLPASQLGFLKYIVQPCFEALTKLLPRGDLINEHVKTNLDFWCDQAEAQGIALHPTLARQKPDPPAAPSHGDEPALGGAELVRTRSNSSGNTSSPSESMIHKMKKGLRSQISFSRSHSGQDMAVPRTLSPLPPPIRHRAASAEPC